MKTVALQVLETAHSSGIRIPKNYTIQGELQRLPANHFSGRQYAFWPAPVNPQEQPLYLNAYEFVVNWELSRIIAEYQRLIAERVVVQEQPDGLFSYTIFGKTFGGFTTYAEALDTGEFDAMLAADDYLQSQMVQAKNDPQLALQQMVDYVVTRRYAGAAGVGAL